MYKDRNSTARYGRRDGKYRPNIEYIRILRERDPTCDVPINCLVGVIQAQNMSSLSSGRAGARVIVTIPTTAPKLSKPLFKLAQNSLKFDWRVMAGWYVMPVRHVMTDRHVTPGRHAMTG